MDFVVDTGEKAGFGDFISEAQNAEPSEPVFYMGLTDGKRSITGGSWMRIRRPI